MMRLEDQMKKEIADDMKKIQVPSSLYDFAKNIKAESEAKEIGGTAMTRRRFKKRYQFIAAAAVTLGVLTASAFMNPAIAEMASKIPYLGQVFKTKPVHEMIHEALVKEGYKDAAFGMRPGEKAEFEVMLEGTKEDADREREKITKIIDKVLKIKGYDNYTIKVTASMPREVTPLTEEDKRMMEVSKAMEEGLKGKGYNILHVNPYNAKIEVNMPVTETRDEEIKAAAAELAKSNGLDKEIDIIKVDLEKQKRESQWHEYLSTIYEGLALKKEYKVSSYGYSYKKNHMKIIIKTTLKPSDSDAKATVEKIRNEIEQFLASEDLKTKVGEDTYEIIIRAKGGKDFNY